MKKGKRVARAEVVLDKEDVSILTFLGDKSFRPMNVVRDYTGLSHNSLLIHIKRLVNHRYVQYYRSPENYKVKLLKITKEGLRIFEELKKSPAVKRMIYEYIEEVTNKHTEIGLKKHGKK